jgi:hypothetical protein
MFLLFRKCTTPSSESNYSDLLPLRLHFDAEIGEKTGEPSDVVGKKNDPEGDEHKAAGDRHKPHEVLELAGI